MEIKVSVRGLVEFLLRTGDIDNRKKSAPDDAMAEGSRIHRMIQKKMGSSYHAEVMLRYRRDCGEYDLVVEGRADGIIDSDPVAVDEIKGTYRDLSRMKEPNPFTACPFRSRTGRDKKSWSRMFIIRSATAENCLSKHRPGRVRRFRRCFRQSRQSGKERRIGFFI